MPRLLIALLLSLLAIHAMARDCDPAHSPQLEDAWLSAGVRVTQPPIRLLYLPPGSREVFVHARTRGPGKVTYRWFRDGKRVIDVGAQVGDGAWNSHSRLRLPPPLPEEVRVQLIGTDGCLLRELTLAASAFVDVPQIRDAWQQLAGGDATGAKITLKLLLEETPRNTPLARHAQRMLDRDVAIAQARERIAAGELFLVESSLKDVERRLGRSAGDRAARTRIADVRMAAARETARLQSEGNLVALATRHLLETEKLVNGDYPLLREDAERLLTPALARAGDHYAIVDWKPTLRGYRLVLQDKRTGGALEVTPD